MSKSTLSTLKILDSKDISELRIIKEISSSVNGKIFEVGKEEKYALKTMHAGELTFKDFQRFIQEYEIISMLDHPNIIRSFSIFLSDESKPPSILLELCPNNLYRIITKQSPTKVEIITYIYQIVEGMKYVHECNIIHRDLKPTNIMLANDGLIRISDFGISKLMSIEEQSMIFDVCTQKFMAPEILKEEKYNEKVDIYSFGVIAYFMLSGGKMPQISIIQIGNGQKAKIPDTFTPFAKDLINKCWNNKPDDRPSFKNILSLLEKNNYELFELTESELKEVQTFVKKHSKLILKTNENNISPIFLTAVNKFTENKKFAYLCSLIIKNARNLIVDPQSKLLYKHFNYDSDLVTILDSICEISEKDADLSDDCGLNVFTLNSIYSQIEGKFGENGQELVNKIIKWAKKQSEGLFGAVDKFIRCLNKKKFIESRMCEFSYIHNANNESVPLLVYTTKNNQNIDIYRRPGCHGLQSPGNIIVLSLIEDTNKKKYGMIIHNDKTQENNNQGVVSIEINNCLFFFPLFESYMDGYFTNENFINIYKTQVPNEKSSLMIYINNISDKSVLSFCPRNNDVHKTMNESISLINSLIPFVPRSIIVRIDDMKCTYEILGNGTCNEYISSIFLDSDDNYPNPYPINRATLEFAASNIDQLKKIFPIVRFALTGENFLYTNNGDEQEFSYPDVCSSIQSVFDSDHPSHLILLVNKEFNKTIDSPLLSWQYKEHKKTKRQDKHLRWNYDETSIPQIEDQDYDDENTTCICICDYDPPKFLPQSMFVYEKDGSTKTFKICKGCILDTFQSMECIQLFDPITKKIDYKELISSSIRSAICLVDSSIDNDEYWPQIPIGQILLTLMCEPNEIYEYVKIWFNVVYNYSLYNSRNYFTFCPNHPETLLHRPKIGQHIKCEHCDMHLCDKCNTWHKLNDKCYDINDEIKRCPNCGQPTFKYKFTGDDRITCPRCRKIWCYKCSKSPIFNSPSECYQHIQEAHSYFD